MTKLFSWEHVRTSSAVLLGVLLCSFAIDSMINSPIAVLLLLQLGIVMVAFKCSPAFSYLTACLGAICFNYFFTAPRYSFHMLNQDDILNLLVFLIVALVTSQFAVRYRQQQILIDQVRLRNQILLSVSHDLRTPLAGIIGNLSTFKEYQALLTESEKDELLNSATAESHRLHQYIENLLQATKMVHGSVRLDKEYCSLASILEGLATKVNANGLRMALSVNALDNIAINRELIEQALFNVIDNALTYSLKDWPITVKASHHQTSIRIDIFNTGITPSAEDRIHMFDLFYSRRQNISTDKGTGLGLSVAKGIITAHGGSIECVKVDAGCLMRIELPKDDAAGVRT